MTFRVGKTAIVIAALIVGSYLFMKLTSCATPSPIIPSVSSEEVTVYRPPIIKVPFIKDKQPVKTENLPIPKDQIKRTITVTIPGEGRKITLVFDKKERVYKTLDTPKSVKVEIVEWKPPLMALRLRLGYTICVLSGEIYHALSTDFFRVGQLWLGADIGVRVQGQKFSDYDLLVGISAKHRVLTLYFDKSISVDIQLALGWDVMEKHFYGGLGIKW